MTGKWPTRDIDHKNRKSLDNRWSNLREATRSQNNMNSKKRGATGAYYLWRSGRWFSKIGRKYIGCFPTKKQAMAAYRAEAIRLYKNFLPS
jgi:hypothetical protein